MRELGYQHIAISSELMNLGIGNQWLNIIRKETISYMFLMKNPNAAYILQRYQPKSDQAFQSTC